MKKLEEQHEEQKLILEQQKKILEELKQHKESHEELKRIELIKNQESKNNIQVSTASAVKQEKMEVQTIGKAEIVKNSALENEHKVDKNSQSNILLDKNYIIESPGKSKNISLDGISKQKTSEINAQVEEKNRIEDSNIKEKVLIKKQAYANNFNKSIDVKPDTPFLSKNTTFIAVSKDKPIHSNIPSLEKKVTKQFDAPEDIKSSEMRVKRRETLAKKNDFEGTVSLPKDSIDLNKIVHNNDQSKT